MDRRATAAALLPTEWPVLADVACVAGGAALLILVATQTGGPARQGLALAFLLAGPGWAVVTNWPGLQRQTRAAGSVLISLVLLTLVATVALWLHQWHPIGIFEVEAGLSILGAGWHLARDRGRGFGPPLASRR